MAELDHLAHELMAHNIAVLHPRNEAVVKVKVGAAYGAARNLHDGIPAVFDFGIGHRFVANVADAFPA